MCVCVCVCVCVYAGIEKITIATKNIKGTLKTNILVISSDACYIVEHCTFYEIKKREFITESIEKGGPYWWIQWQEVHVKLYFVSSVRIASLRPF